MNSLNGNKARCQPRHLVSRSLGDDKKYVVEITVSQRDIDALKRVCGLLLGVANKSHDYSQLKNLEYLSEEIYSKFTKVRQSSVSNFFFYCEESYPIDSPDTLVFFQAKCGTTNMTQKMVNKLSKNQIETVEKNDVFCLKAKFIPDAFKLLEKEGWIGHYEDGQN